MKENFYVKNINSYYDHFLKIMYLKFKMLKEMIKKRKIVCICLFMQCFKVCTDTEK